MKVKPLFTCENCKKEVPRNNHKQKYCSPCGPIASKKQKQRQYLLEKSEKNKD